MSQGNASKNTQWSSVSRLIKVWFIGPKECMCFKVNTVCPNYVYCLYFDGLLLQFEISIIYFLPAEYRGWHSTLYYCLFFFSGFQGAESFGLYSCVINGEERDQSHRAVYRWRRTTLSSSLSHLHPYKMLYHDWKHMKFYASFLMNMKTFAQNIKQAVSESNVGLQLMRILVSFYRLFNRFINVSFKSTIACQLQRTPPLPHKFHFMVDRLWHYIVVFFI